MSVEIYQGPAGWLECEHGRISESNARISGVIDGMGDLILVTVPFERDTKNLALCGIDFTVTDGVARTVAKNGTWLHQLEPAHWRGGVVPFGWSEKVMLGRLVADPMVHAVALAAAIGYTADALDCFIPGSGDALRTWIPELRQDAARALAGLSTAATELDYYEGAPV